MGYLSKRHKSPAPFREQGRTGAGGVHAAFHNSAHHSGKELGWITPLRAVETACT